MIVLSSRLRWLVTVVFVAIPVVGLIVSVLTLPVFAALLITAFLSLLSWVLNRVLFRRRTLLVMASPTEAMNRYSFGTAWSCDADTMGDVILSLVYLNRSAARDAYHMLSTWSFGRRIDTEGHIRLSIVDEGDARYSIVVMPGEREPAQMQAAALVRQTVGPKSIVDVSTLRPFIRNCVEYSTRPEVDRVMQSLPFKEYVMLQVAFVNHDRVVPYAKQAFRLYKFVFRRRADLPDCVLEADLLWEDLRSKAPAYIRDVADRLDRESKTPKAPPESPTTQHPRLTGSTDPRNVNGGSI